MADNKITKRDNYNALRDMVLANADIDVTERDQLVAFIDHELELMAQRAEKSKEYQKAHKATNDAMTDLIRDTLCGSETALSVADLMEKIPDSSTQKIVYRLGQLFKAGVITKETQTIKAGDASPRKVTFYTYNG